MTAAEVAQATTAVSSDGKELSVPNVAATTKMSQGYAGEVGGFRLAEEPAELGLTPPALQIESIRGKDDRYRITNTTTFPSRAIVQITRNGGAHCSGWMINANTVATAGHCVHSGNAGSWYTGLRAYPGRNGSSAPYGSCTVRTSYSVLGWTNSGDERFDYGALKLNCTVGNSTGWFGYWWQSASLNGTTAIVQGYPGDKPFGQQWRGDKYTRYVATTTSNQVFYPNDTAGGMSGSPVFQYRSGCGYCSMAVHAYGLHGSWPHSSYNHGTRITQSVFNNYQAWKSA
ncbi:MAG: trypsin-like serine peptidase [Actinomycetales bacterium]